MSRLFIGKVVVKRGEEEDELNGRMVFRCFFLFTITKRFSLIRTVEIDESKGSY